MRHVVFLVESERYALPLSAVREVVPQAPISRIPRGPPALRGIMNLRGRVVAVVDLKALFGIGAAAPHPSGTPPPGRVVVLERGRRDLGLLAADVAGVANLEDIATAPGEAAPSIRGIARTPAGAVTVLDVEGLERQLAQLARPA